MARHRSPMERALDLAAAKANPDRKLYLVSLESFAGGMIAGGHFLAANADEARAIGEKDLATVSAGIPAAMAERQRAALAAGYFVRVKPSKASRSNALN